MEIRAGTILLFTRALLLQHLGRKDEAAQAIRAMRRALPHEPLELWLALIRNAYLPERMREMFEANLTAAWNATPEAAKE